MPNPTVSIIIPCYNSEKTISETLDSVLGQTLQDWEAIVVNDGSTDNSAEIISRYASIDRRIRQINQENQGLPQTRNIALKVATGEFVNFLDADDLLQPDMLRKMKKELDENPSFGAIHCGWIRSSSDLKDMNWFCYFRSEGQLFDKLAHAAQFPCHSIVFRREILDNTGMFDCSIRHSQDWDLWLRFARAGVNFGHIHEPLVIYRMMPVSMSRNPLTLFEAEKEVISRGHKPDPRVKSPAPEFAQGCNCSMEKAIFGRLISNVAYAIAKGNSAQASELFEMNYKNLGIPLTTNVMKSMMESIWLGSAIPRGNWDALLPKVGYSLMQFLVREEEFLGIQSFAMQSMLDMIGWHSNPEKMFEGRELVIALGDKIKKRFIRLLRINKKDSNYPLNNVYSEIQK